jgi:hypothetical protein
MEVLKLEIKTKKTDIERRNHQVFAEIASSHLANSKKG